jgi:UDP-glucose 4-epimerase
VNVLITGGAGFIGSHLVDYHLKKGDNVKIIDDLSTGTLQNLELAYQHPNFRKGDMIPADLESYSDLESLVKWSERVYHLAAAVGMLRVMDDPKDALDVNIEGTRRLLDCITYRQRFIFASTSEVYELKANTGHFNYIRWNYALSKLAGEALTSSYAKKYNLNITNIRLFNTIGPRQRGYYGMVVPRFVEQAIEDKPITVYGTGNQTRCFCDVLITVNALDRLATLAATIGKTFNIGASHSISIMDLAKLIKKRTLSRSDIVTMNYVDVYPDGYEDVLERKPSLVSTLKFVPDLDESGNFIGVLDRIIEEKRQSETFCS